jgi:hypothetical protein
MGNIQSQSLTWAERAPSRDYQNYITRGGGRLKHAPVLLS